MAIHIPTSWHERLKEETTQPYFLALAEFVEREYASTKCYPAKSEIFNALEWCAPDEVKVVIIGQDPYHGPGQAHGLCFSVNDGVKLPPSLVNIFKELHRSLDVPPPITGNLERWAKQGVLLLNAVMTVRAGNAGSHRKKGWERFTDKIIQQISEQQSSVVFLLWGDYAIAKAQLIDADKHYVLTSPHPSPLSAYRGFIGNDHFSKCNLFLERVGKTPINWE
ncbi:MAG: Uracil-DNA glycosylase [Bacteroidota bacterium]